MIIFKTANELSNYLQQQKKRGKRIGFVPTMGALHNGHLSLINRANNENGLSICSIFINPTQFNNPADFTHYPVTIEKDIEQLIAVGCNVLFLPCRSEIYYEQYKAKQFNLGRLEEVLEGHYRPGHFQGVCQVVDRLLEIIPADNLYLGQKDYQQCMVIKRLLQLSQRTSKLQLTIAPTIREENGLAMSSRNMRLTPEQKKSAEAISQTLFYIKANLQLQSLTTLKTVSVQKMQSKGFQLDYVEIADGDTLETATSLQQPLVALIAASIGGVRLIDNIILK